MSYGCHTCKVDVKVGAGDVPDYWFYQVKKMGTVKYVIDYAFCSQECMTKYTAKRKTPE